VRGFSFIQSTRGLSSGCPTPESNSVPLELLFQRARALGQQEDKTAGKHPVSGNDGIVELVRHVVVSPSMLASINSVIHTQNDDLFFAA
jgi:hypothetical protein